MALLLVLLSALPPAFANGPDETAWLLTNLRLGTAYPLRSIQLREALSDKRLSITPKGRPPDQAYQLRNVRPGDYHVSRVMTYFDNVTAASFEQPADLSEVAPGRISYIGDIVVSGIRRPDIGFATRYEHLIFRNTLAAALRSRPGEFAQYPVYLALPGMKPVEFDAVTFIEDTEPTVDSTGLFQVRERMWWLRVAANHQANACWITAGEVALALSGHFDESGQMRWSDPLLLDRVHRSSAGFTLTSADEHQTLVRADGNRMEVRCLVALYGR